MPACLQANLTFEIVGYWLLAWGVVGFLAMGIDKARAVGGEWRIPEKTRLIMALAGGPLGMVLGRWLFHHKTSKVEFLIILYSTAALWVYLLLRVGFLDCLSTYLPH